MPRAPCSMRCRRCNVPRLGGIAIAPPQCGLSLLAAVLSVPTERRLVTVLLAVSQLMGKERNVPLQERSNKTLHFYDKVGPCRGTSASCRALAALFPVAMLLLEPALLFSGLTAVITAPQDICKYRIAGLCPYQLFTNTRSYLGACASACSSATPRPDCLQTTVNTILALDAMCWDTWAEPVGMPLVRRQRLDRRVRTASRFLSGSLGQAGTVPISVKADILYAPCRRVPVRHARSAGHGRDPGGVGCVARPGEGQVRGPNQLTLR